LPVGRRLVRPAATAGNVLRKAHFCICVAICKAFLHIHSCSLDPVFSITLPLCSNRLNYHQRGRHTCHARGGQKIVKQPLGLDIVRSFPIPNNHLLPESAKMMRTSNFRVVSNYGPAGDQQAAIDKLGVRLPQERRMTLLGATGTGKTFVVANLIELLRKPTLIVNHNLNLCNQTYEKLKSQFPHCFVEMFTSKYDLFVPEHVDRNGKRVPPIVKVNTEVAKKRRAIFEAVAEGREVIVVATYCCFNSVADKETDGLGFTGHDNEKRPSLRDSFCQAYGEDFLVVVDESHLTIGQIFRKGALKQPPVTLAPYVLCVSATPGYWEQEHCPGKVYMVQRPTHILDPTIDVFLCKRGMHRHKIMEEVLQAKKERQQVLIFCNRKVHAMGISHFLNSNTTMTSHHITCDHTLEERKSILRRFQTGQIDVLVCVNTVREGMDFPGVGLVLVMNADSGGLFRSTRSLVQLCGRAARNSQGRVIFFASNVSTQMRECIEKHEEQRSQQKKFNHENELTPSSVCVQQRRQHCQQCKTINTGPKREHVRLWTRVSRSWKMKRLTIKPSTEEEEFLYKCFKGDGTPQVPGVPCIFGPIRKFGSLDAIHEAAKSGKLREEYRIGRVRCKKLADPHTIETIKQCMDILKFLKYLDDT